MASRAGSDLSNTSNATERALRGCSNLNHSHDHLIGVDNGSSVKRVFTDRFERFSNAVARSAGRGTQGLVNQPDCVVMVVNHGFRSGRVHVL